MSFCCGSGIAIAEVSMAICGLMVYGFATGSWAALPASKLLPKTLGNVLPVRLIMLCLDERCEAMA